MHVRTTRGARGSSLPALPITVPPYLVEDVIKFIAGMI